MKYFILSAVIFFFLVFYSPVKAQFGNLVTNGVIYNSDSSALISRSNSTKIQVPENLINPTQSWVAIRVKMGFASTTTLSPDPVMWDMSQSDPADLFLYFDVGSDTFHFVRASKIGGKTLSSLKQTFSVGALKTVIVAWTSTTMKLSIDGGAFTTTNESIIPAQAAFLIGSTLIQGSGRQPNSDYYWVAAGTGTLTDQDAQTIHGFNTSDKKRSDFPGNATFVWWANSNSFNDDGVVSSTPTTSSFPSLTNTPRPTNTFTITQTFTPTVTIVIKQGDANNDGKVDGIDFVIWLSNYNKVVLNGASQGDFNRDGKVDGVDYAIWLSHYS
jgi:hypothetical protein